jgi:hypothetical protein
MSLRLLLGVIAALVESRKVAAPALTLIETEVLHATQTANAQNSS